MNSITIFLLFLVIVPMYIITIFIPFWTRRTESFGISIPEEIYDTSELKALRKKYVLYTSLLSVLATILFFTMAIVMKSEESFSIGFTTFVVLYFILSFLIYLKFHGTMIKLKTEKNWLAAKSQQIYVDTNFRKQKLTYSNYWFIIPVLLTFVIIFLTIQFYGQIPNKIPMQYNFQGEVTNWVEKSYRSVLQLPVMMLYLTLLFLFVNTTIEKAKQQINVQQPDVSMQKNIIFRRRWSAYIIISGIALIVLFALIQLSFIFPIEQQILMIYSFIVTGGMLVGALVLSITTGQGGSRIKSITTKTGQVIDRDDDKHWKLGQFYFNKEDPALFLEKRFGIGWTINLARPLAWITLIIIIGLAFAIPMILN